MKLALALLLTSQVSLASTVAIIDSGVDTNHPDLVNKIWTNSFDGDDGIDNDQNGYIDDIKGWNFSANNNQVINYKYLPLVSDEDVLHYVKISASIMEKDNSEWLKEVKRSRPNFGKDVRAFANFSHGTHVAGIAAKDNDNAIILPIKLLPTDADDIAEKAVEEIKSVNIQKKKGLRFWLVKKLVKRSIKKAQENTSKIGSYINSHKVEIANGSYGTGYKNAKLAAKKILSKVTFGTPYRRDIKELAYVIVDTMVEEGSKLVDAAPNTLFVFAAGNDGANNDVFPTAPANVERDNVISVAATDGYNSIATFSNFGEKTVDVAAPGVKINSSIPGGGHLRVSGTSQAAPYVSNIASMVKDANPELSPKQIKQIILETVTVKPFLKGIVRTSGIANKDRAIRAAKLSNTMPIDKAIKRSK